MAHSVSPIWAGIFVSLINYKFLYKKKFYSFKFAFCGGTGIVCARQKSLYVVNKMNVLQSVPLVNLFQFRYYAM
jgi:hypothetical protein